MTTITNINQLLPLVEERPEFIVIDKSEYTVIDYVYQAADTFDDPLLLECRGIKFTPDGLILARPFRKFFNYGEKGSGLPVHRPHVITEKLDGSMIHPVRLGRHKYLMTRKGHTDVAKKAERFLFDNPNMRYGVMFDKMIDNGWTPILEYIGPNNRIVLRYDEPSLVLLAARHTIEGGLMPYNDLKGWGDAYGIPVVSPVLPPHPQADPTVSVQGFVDHVRGLENAEGYVVYFDDGYMVKVKAEDYVLKHRALDDMSSKKKVVALCCQGFTDDVLPILSEEDKEELNNFNNRLQFEIINMARIASNFASWVTSGDMTRKEFALRVAPAVKPAWLAGVVYGILDGKNAHQLALKAVEKGGYEDIGVKWRGE